MRDWLGLMKAMGRVDKRSATVLLDAIHDAAPDVFRRTREELKRRSPEADHIPDEAINAALSFEYEQFVNAVRTRATAAPARLGPLLGQATGGTGCAELAEIGWDADLCLQLVRTLLFKDVTRQDLASLAAVFGINTDRTYMAFRARPDTERELWTLAAELGASESLRMRSGLVATIDGDLVGFLQTPPPHVRGGVVGLGLPRRLDRLTESFQSAGRALEVARAFGRHGVYSMDTLGLLPTIVADSDVGEILQRRYLAPRCADPLPPEVIATIGTFFAADMNVERAAAKMALHSNTVRNRIARFEDRTGANLRDVGTAMEVWWALQRTLVAGLPTDRPQRQVSRPTPDPMAEPTMQVVPTNEAGCPDATRRQAEFLRGLLRGTLPRAELSRELLAHGVDARRQYRALRARPARGVSLDELARAHGFVFGHAKGGGLGAVVRGDLVGFVPAPPSATVPGISGIGPAGPVQWLAKSFRMASRALHVAESRGMSGVCEFESVALAAALRSDEAVGQALCRRYLDPLGHNEFAVEIVETLQTYLDQGRRVSQTAERLFVHPNTVRYRIGRYEELTGANLRRTPVVFEVLAALWYRSAHASVPRPRSGHAGT